MNRIKPKKYTEAKKLICSWSDKKKVLVRYRMLKLYVGHGMIVDKYHEIFFPLNKISDCKTYKF